MTFVTARGNSGGFVFGSGFLVRHTLDIFTQHQIGRGWLSLSFLSVPSRFDYAANPISGSRQTN